MIKKAVKAPGPILSSAYSILSKPKLKNASGKEQPVEVKNKRMKNTALRNYIEEVSVEERQSPILTF